MFGLEYLISPIPVKDFSENYFEKKALLVRNNDDKFPDLFSWDDLSNIVNERSSGNDKISLVHNKQILPPKEFNNIDHWMRAGSTLVIDSIHNLDAVLERFANLLARDVNSSVWINSYTSWPQKQGFDNHVDLHDVFIIQTEGSKIWRVFEPTEVSYPIEQQRTDLPRGTPPDDSKMYLECTLKKGDVLYIPRGHWHYAISETPCIHLTVAMKPRSAIDFLQWYLPTLVQEEIFRENFPVLNANELGGSGPAAGLTTHLDKIQQRIHELLCDKNLHAKLIEYFMVSNPIKKKLVFPIESTLEDEMNEETLFSHVEGQKYLVNYDHESESALVLARGKVVELSHIPYSVLKKVFLEESTVTGKEILELDSGLEWEKIKKLLQQLFTTGVLAILPE